ncbi:hypothetical protein Mycch_4629 [Mycolicibacterium chubuense NBB4]|uniref:Alanine and proline rich membrane protein n=1 Tax=Mycolicibacterium chubuense (strain NBB4) TaxID=710421 RepID=I4BPX4_MYCCN|nr:hypothetical protein [Mycolicibacterium chubuense]AFM19331.1 hypothetical protein Mycch_4629 [Mycolicibacterium chubuense NBB4]
MSDSATSHPARRSAPGWIAPAALAVAVVAVALAVWALVRAPESGQTAPASSEQSAQAKTQVCNAFTTVRSAVSLQTNANLGNDRVATQAVAANARLATLGGGQYLLSRLTDAVPTDLADAVRSFANDLQDIGMGQLAGLRGDDPTQTGHMNNAQKTAEKITGLCK